MFRRVALLLETATALNTRLMAREEAADTNGCSSEDLHGGTEQQSCVLQHGDGASEYRLLRAEDNKQNLQENLSDVNTGLCYIITLMCAVEVNIIFVSISYACGINARHAALSTK